MRIIFSFAILVNLFQFNNFLSAQEIWTLEKCIDHAKKNNLTVKQFQNLKILAYKDFLTSKLNFLPDLNVSYNTGNTWGKYADPTIGAYSLEKSSSSSVEAISSIDLFNGLNKIQNFKQKKEAYHLSQHEIEKNTNELILNITALYIKILLDKDNVKNSEKQAEITSLQIEKTEKFVQAGVLPQGDVYNLKSQYASEELNIINTKNTLETDYLNLKQLLEIEDEKPITIASPAIDLLSTDPYPQSIQQIYNIAKDSLPDLKISNSKLIISRFQYNIALGNNFPIFRGSGRIGSSTSNILPEKLFKQYDNNVREYIGISLVFPIFNNWQTSYQTSLAYIDYKNKELEFEQVKKQLYKDISIAYQGLTAAQKRFYASQNNYTAHQEAFQYAKQKYDNGLVTSIEFADIKNKYSRAESELLQSKYEYIYRRKILDFYNGKAINF